MLGINDIKGGMAIIYEDEIYLLIDCQQVKPGKGSAFTRVKMKNLKNFTQLDRTFRAGEKFEQAFLEEKPITFLYKSGEDYIFMDHVTYEQFSLPPVIVDRNKDFLKEEMEVKGVFYNNSIIMLNLPPLVELKIEHTEPGFKGDTAKGGTKPATLETGATIQVPLFINIDDIIKVDTRTGEYSSRA